MSWSLSCFATASVILKDWRYRYACRFLSDITVSGNRAQGKLVAHEVAGKMIKSRQIGCLFFHQRRHLAAELKVESRIFGYLTISFDPFAERLAYSQAED
jgi:hypothetical protein